MIKNAVYERIVRFCKGVEETTGRDEEGAGLDRVRREVKKEGGL